MAKPANFCYVFADVNPQIGLNVIYKYASCSVCTYSAYETLRLPLPATAANETEMYEMIQQPAIPARHDNSPAAAVTATDAAAGNNDYEIPTLFLAYQTLQLPPTTTTSNGTEMYARLQQPAVPGVQENSPAAATATVAGDAAGVDNGGYEIPIPTEVAPSPPHTYIQILPDTN